MVLHLNQLRLLLLKNADQEEVTFLLVARLG
ncbi:Uncharacterised protein [Segatella copri]|nr:Uncharacterised protein [Segatella copri]